MITVSVTGNNAQEVAAKLADVYQTLVSKPVETKTEPAKVEPKPGPKATKAKPEAKVDAKPETKAEVPPIENVRAALMTLSKKKGDDEVWKLLESYESKSASTVPEDKRAELIKKVEGLVA